MIFCSSILNGVRHSKAKRLPELKEGKSETVPLDDQGHPHTGLESRYAGAGHVATTALTPPAQSQRVAQVLLLKMDLPSRVKNTQNLRRGSSFVLSLGLLSRSHEALPEGWN